MEDSQKKDVLFIGTSGQIDNVAEAPRERYFSTRNPSTVFFVHTDLESVVFEEQLKGLPKVFAEIVVGRIVNYDGHMKHRQSDKDALNTAKSLLQALGVVASVYRSV